MDEFHEIKQRLDKYGDKLSEHETMHAMHIKDIQELKDQGVRVCKLLTETKENLMTRFDNQDTLLQQLLADKHRKEGAEAALQQSQKAEIEKFSMRIQLFKLVPDLIKMLGYVGVGYMLIQQISPHK
jgi:uncharacterized membrane-anchored protein YhcB (DUF1043 family)